MLLMLTLFLLFLLASFLIDSVFLPCPIVFISLKKQVHVGRGRHSGPCAIHRIPLHARKSTLVGQPQQVSFFLIKKMIQ